MSKLSPKAMAIVAAATAAGFSGVTIAGAADSSTTSTSGSTTTPAAKQRPTGAGAGETALTGTTKEQVEAAALAKVPGTVIRTETDNGGVYESHIRKADGTEVEVKVDKDFKVTAVQTAPSGGRGSGGRGGHDGHGGRGGDMHGDLTAVAKALGVTEAKLQSALQSARPAAPNGTKADRGTEEAAAIAKSLGESTADVKTVLDATHEAGGGHRGGPGGHEGDDTALVAALVKKFSVSQAKAQAAVDAADKAQEADHTARETALYAAVAKALGKDTAAVQKAFEAGRPAQPATP